MRILTLAGHSIDADWLGDSPRVLDVGCRDFEFDHLLLELRPKARIVALDPDPTIVCTDQRILYLPGALTTHGGLAVNWVSAGEASQVVPWGTPGSIEVPNYTLAGLMGRFWDHFDLVKLDCEGSEFGILEDWPGPIATQISVEFHDWTNRTKWNAEYFSKLFAGPLKEYDVLKFELTPIGPDLSLGHWDSLLALKGLCNEGTN